MRPLFVFLLVTALATWGAWATARHWRSRAARDRQAEADAAAQPARPPPSSEPIVLVIPRGVDWFAMNWGVFLALLGVLLLVDPQALGSRWLSWPAAVVLLVVGPMGIRMGWPKPDGALTVAPDGLGLQWGREPALRLAWSDLAAITVVRPNRRLRGAAQPTLLRFERAGHEPFAAVPVPEGPFDAHWSRLMDSLPYWCGRTIEATIE